MMQEIQNLQEIARCCADGEPLDKNLSHWLGRALDDFLNQREPNLSEALGLQVGRGGVPWWLERDIRDRNESIRELAARLNVTGSISARARQIHTIAVRYEVGAWRYDRDHEAMPVNYARTPKECLWRAFKSGATMPLCERQLRTILE